jgi:hypothetical protein
MRPSRNEPVQCVRCLSRYNPETDPHYVHTWRAEPAESDSDQPDSGGVVLCPSCHQEFLAFVELQRGEVARTR